jgi:hypothetical protein
MCEYQACQFALVDMCTEFLIYLNDMEQKGIISKAEYESYSMMKVRFLNEIGKGPD